MTDGVAHQTPRLLLIGIDGATWDWLDPLMADGTMPTCRDLVARGSHAVLRSVTPPLTPSAWATVLTGKNPGGHGIFDFSRTPSRFAPPDQQKAEYVSSKLLPRPYLYDLVGAAGKHVISINMPMTYPPHQINGCMITGMFTPRGSSSTFPADLQERLADYEVDLKPGEGPQVDAWLLGEEEIVEYEGSPLVSGSRRVLAKRAQAALTLMADEPWDLFAIVLTGGDRISHHLWDTMHHPENPGAAKINKDIRTFFAELDDAVARLVDAAGPDTTVMFVSDHGFGPGAKRRIHFDLWLEQVGLARRKTTLMSLIRKVPGNRAARLAVKALLKRLLPERTSVKLVSKVENRKKQLDQATDLSRTLVKSRPFCTGVCGFDINPQLAPPGSDTYEETRSLLIEKLSALRDPQTDEPIVEKAMRREDIYNGPFTDAAPNVIAHLNFAYFPFVDPWAKELVVAVPGRREGDHRFEGVFALTHGPAKPGRIPEQPLDNVAPTALYLLGLGIPDDMTGQVIEQAIQPAQLEAHPPDRKAADQTDWQTPAEGSGYTEEEEADIEQRLKDIGYL